MTPPTLTSRRALLAVMLAGTAALGVGACGRRGRPQPPSDASTQQKAQADKTKNAASGKSQPTFATRPTPASDDDNDEEEDQRQKEDPAGANPLPTTSRKKPQPYAVPKQPFFLDFLL